MEQAILQLLKTGLDHFREDNYFGAHHHWEDAWKTMQGNRRLFWQGMILLTVGAYHYSRGNKNGCVNMFNKASQKCHILLAQADIADHTPVEQLNLIVNTCLQIIETGKSPLPYIHKSARTIVSDEWMDFQSTKKNL